MSSTTATEPESTAATAAASRSSSHDVVVVDDEDDDTQQLRIKIDAPTDEKYDDIQVEENKHYVEFLEEIEEDDDEEEEDEEKEEVIEEEEIVFDDIDDDEEDEEEDDDDDEVNNNHDDNNENNNNDDDLLLVMDQLPPDVIDDIVLHQQRVAAAAAAAANTNQQQQQRPFLFTYRPLSILLFSSLLWYAIRTRKQYYFTTIYLCHSKLAHVIFGNTVVVIAILLFDLCVFLFFRTTTTTTTTTAPVRTDGTPNTTNNTSTTTTTTTTSGLRIQEAEGLQDFFRWNVTETCLALTMFRYELSVLVMIQFVLVILLKCLHYITIQREQHLRMTEDPITTMMMISTKDPNDDHDEEEEEEEEEMTTSTSSSPAKRNTYVFVLIRRMMVFVRSNHTSIIVFLILLQMMDMYMIQQGIQQIIQSGHPSIQILFAFEAAILLVSTYSHLVLYLLHLIDCSIHYGNDASPDHPTGSTTTSSTFHTIAKRLIHPWKEYKATFIFAIELQSQVLNFVFYCTFFCIVFTFYGLPINLFREVYVSFMRLKERLIAFFHYRQLMASMNRFRTATDEELNVSGRICIICRDEMTSGHDCKRLPICTHTFHKSCLREWLVQQQSCPTCRADIAAMEALEASRTATANAATQRTTVAAAATAADTPSPTTTVTIDGVTQEETATTTVPLLSAAPTSTTTPTSTTGVDSFDPLQASSLSPNTTTVQGLTTGTTTHNALATTANDNFNFSSTSTVIHTTKDTVTHRGWSTTGDAMVGVIQPMNPTLYEVIGTSIDDNNNIVAATDVPVYSHDSIVTATISPSHTATLAPIRTIRPHALILGMATYQKQFAPYESPPTTTTITTNSTPQQLPELISYIQLPDQTWIRDDQVRSIYKIQNYTRK